MLVMAIFLLYFFFMAGERLSYNTDVNDVGDMTSELNVESWGDCIAFVLVMWVEHVSGVGFLFLSFPDCLRLRLVSFATWTFSFFISLLLILSFFPFLSVQLLHLWDKLHHLWDIFWYIKCLYSRKSWMSG